MKKIKLLSLLSLFMVATFTSCTDDDKGERVYKGASLLNFHKGVSRDVFVFSGTGFTEITIDYGVLKPVAGDNTVSLVLDTENSTAVEGVDFEIVDGTDELTDGETTGQFTVKFLEGGAVQAGKIAKFKMSSSTLDSATFNEVYTVNVSLSCPINTFVGDFDATSWWLGNSTHTVVEGAAANTIQINDFWSDNATAPNFILSYNDAYVVTFAPQNTGYFVAQYNGYIWARMSTDATQVSSFNPCTRTMKVYVNYYIPNVGSYGNKEEVFTGI
jgi:hypothetical protein